MQIKVHMLAFNDDNPSPVRVVDVPQEDYNNVTGHSDPWMLADVVYCYGQNDFQARPIRSVSVGDVIEFPDGRLLRVRGVGFEVLPEGTDLAKLERGTAACFLH